MGKKTKTELTLEKAKEYLGWIENPVVINKYELTIDLETNWINIISGICKNLEAEKALIINEIFGFVFDGDIELAMDYIDDLIKL